MAEALVGGLLSTGWATSSQIGVVEISAARRAELTQIFPGVVIAENATDASVVCEDYLIAVKPQHVEVVARAVSNTCTRALSIAAGVRLDALRSWFGTGTRVIRVMPNTPALVGLGAAAIAAAPDASSADVEWARGILSSVGTVEVVDEFAMDAVTALSGSGPAYLFLLAEAMRDAGVAQGLDREMSTRLTRQTLLGAATLLSKSGEEPQKLRSNVTSPAGTTAAAIGVMQNSNLESIVADAIAAAAARSKELGDS